MRSSSKRLFWLFPALLFLGACHRHAHQTLEIHAGAYDRHATPIWVDLPETWEDFPFFWLMNEQTEQYLPVQKAGDGRLAFILDQPLPAGQSRRYRLTRVHSDPNDDLVRVIEDSSQIRVQIDQRPVLTYHSAVVFPPGGAPSHFARSGFIHPLFSPGGQVLTEGFPQGHLHQHGIFFAWVRTRFEGRELDFWNQHKEQAQVSHAEVVDLESGEVFGRFIVRLLHQENLPQGGARDVLNETWTLTVYQLTDYFLLDLRSIQTPAGILPLEVEEYHYGGLGFRANSQWLDPGYDAERDAPANALGPGQGAFLTSEGQGRIAGNHSRPVWVDMHGKIDNSPVGLAIMGHPDNFRFPQHVRIHPAMPYFCFAPSVAGPFTLEPGDRYESHFRFFVHQGAADTSQINARWHDYAEPLTWEWVED